MGKVFPASFVLSAGDWFDYPENSAVSGNQDGGYRECTSDVRKCSNNGKITSKT